MKTKQKVAVSGLMIFLMLFLSFYECCCFGQEEKGNDGVSVALTTNITIINNNDLPTENPEVATACEGVAVGIIVIIVGTIVVTCLYKLCKKKFGPKPTSPKPKPVPPGGPDDPTQVPGIPQINTDTNLVLSQITLMTASSPTGPWSPVCIIKAGYYTNDTENEIQILDMNSNIVDWSSLTNNNLVNGMLTNSSSLYVPWNFSSSNAYFFKTYGEIAH